MSGSHDAATGTLTHVGERASKKAPGAVLYLALEGERPLGGSSRHALGGFGSTGLGRVDVVLFGRAAERKVERVEASGERRLVLGVADRWMSTTHARLVRVLDQWLVEDAGSKNGTFLNGEPVERATLSDGDLVEVGHSFFVFRAAQALPPEAPLDVAAATLSAGPPGTATRVPALATQLARLADLARSEVSIVVHGESGTGKELAARAVHALSGRSGPFVAVNCGALPRTLLESELFGHKKGAFSGAIDDRPGLVRSAEQGTLFLDEIGDLPLDAQPAFLRVLQEREFERVGAARPLKVDVRLVAATHRDLDALVAAGGFRGDLAARIAGFTLTLPPLRERKEELGTLVADLLSRSAAERAGRIRFGVDAARALFFHDWPLNVRELEKCLGAAAVLATDGMIRAEHLPQAVQRGTERGKAQPGSAAAAGDDEEADRPLGAAELRHKDELVALLREHAGNISAVARALGKARMQIQRWIRRYRIDPGALK